jgi:hypothetical protein
MFSAERAGRELVVLQVAAAATAARPSVASQRSGGEPWRALSWLWCWRAAAASELGTVPAGDAGSGDGLGAGLGAGVGGVMGVGRAAGGGKARPRGLTSVDQSRPMTLPGDASGRLR